MKKITIVLILAVVFLSPGTDVLAAKNTEKLVVTSFYPMYIMALNVTAGVPEVRVENLAGPQAGCLHDYALTVKNMTDLAGAGLFAVNGAGMESFLERVAGQYPNLKIVRCAEGISLLPSMNGKDLNPHVWVSFSGAIAEIKNLGKAMEAFDPQHAELYRRNTARYVGELEKIRIKMQTALSPYRGRKIITFHEAFSYFAQEFDLQVITVVEREPGSAPDARELAATIDKVKKTGIKVLFAEPQYPSLAGETIAKETGARIYFLDPAVTGPDDPGAYLRIMEKNLATLKEALTC